MNIATMFAFNDELEKIAGRVRDAFTKGHKKELGLEADLTAYNEHAVNGKDQYRGMKYRKNPDDMEYRPNPPRGHRASRYGSSKRVKLRARNRKIAKGGLLAAGTLGAVALGHHLYKKHKNKAQEPEQDVHKPFANFSTK